MDVNTFLVLVIIICSCIFFAGFAGERLRCIRRILTRGVMGCLIIWAVGFALNMFAVGSPVGLNMWTASVCALLGMPGVVMLYAVGMYSLV